MTRTVTNVSTDDAGIYDVKVSAPAGTTVTVSPTHLVVPPGKSKSFTVKITRTTASARRMDVRVPHLDRGQGQDEPTQPQRPQQHRGPAGRRGGAVRDLRLGDQPARRPCRSCPATPARSRRRRTGSPPTADTAVSLTGTNTNFNPAAPAAGPAVAKVTVNVPAGTRLSRFATFDADYGAGTDIDLFVYNAGTNTLRGQSAGGTAEESVTGLPAGDYDIYVVLFAQPGGGSGAFDGARALVHRPGRGEQPDGDTGIAVGDVGGAGDGDDRLERPRRGDAVPRRGRLRRRFEHDRLHDRGGDPLAHTAAATRPPTQHETTGGRDSRAHRFRLLRSKNRLVSHFRLTVPAVARTLSRTHY